MIIFIRTPQYNSSNCLRKLQFYTEDCEPVNVTWCWCIRKQDLQSFLKTYDDVQWKVIKPSRYIYAVDFKIVDELLTTEDNNIEQLFKQLTLEQFNPEKHCLQRKTITRDNGYDVEAYDYFDNKYAIILSDKDIAWIGLSTTDSNPECPFECEYFKVIV